MFNISKKNISLIVSFFLIIGLMILCWKIFTNNQKTDQKQDLNPSKYENIIKKINNKNVQNLHEAENFIIKNKNIYGTLTALSLSKKYILNNKLNEAFIALNNSLEYTKEENLKILLQLNIVKIKIEKNQNKQAIEILKQIHNHNWDNIIEQIKGDIFININKKKEAIQSWKKSLLTENSNASKEIINMKINNIKD
ncbi:YfgM family protein [Buchnera aphidicola]|uniref:Conserved protein n=1 Tax=Buchnera aphidicola str. Ua (Uroleucon ambrosiae) TaxID=1005057 RepID=G2LNP8_BUCUM|nr:tetratricopeptide repeat protein [Buchnera aphidicola]AEO08364.1 conserved protein [Buchnera aphidicola str. Ua (Uroleucon ambrosiae)]